MNDTNGINRRELLRRAALLLGGSLSAPAVLGVMNGCSADAAPDWKPVFHTPSQIALVAEVADIMIPRTDTPGARDAGVPAFIDTMLAEVYPRADQSRYLRGLSEFEAAAREQAGQAFLDLDTAARRGFVQRVHDAAQADGGVPREDRPFILMTKELTLLGFFTSREGATLVLQHDPLPGAYRGCLPLAETGNGRTWATEKNLPF